MPGDFADRLAGVATRSGQIPTFGSTEQWCGQFDRKIDIKTG
jgi:hypothetical protein